MPRLRLFKMLSFLFANPKTTIAHTIPSKLAPKSASDPVRVGIKKSCNPSITNAYKRLMADAYNVPFAVKIFADDFKDLVSYKSSMVSTPKRAKCTTLSKCGK